MNNDNYCRKEKSLIWIKNNRNFDKIISIRAIKKEL